MIEVIEKTYNYKELSWLITAGMVHIEPQYNNAVVFCKQPRICGSNAPRRKHGIGKIESAEVVLLAKEGLRNMQIFEQLSKKGFFVDGNGNPMGQSRATNLIMFYKTKAGIKRGPVIHKHVKKMLGDGKSREEVQDELDITDTQLYNACRRAGIRCP